MSGGKSFPSPAVYIGARARPPHLPWGSWGWLPGISPVYINTLLQQLDHGPPASPVQGGVSGAAWPALALPCTCPLHLGLCPAQTTRARYIQELGTKRLPYVLGPWQMAEVHPAGEPTDLPGWGRNLSGAACSGSGGTINN